MSVGWTHALVRDALDREELRLERLGDAAQRGRLGLRHARALDALEAARRGAAGMAEVIERAALRDDVASLAQAQVRIQQQREQIGRLEATIAALRAEQHIDALTGCLDRGGFEETFAREWGRAVRGRTSLGLVFIDVDHFKDVNDQLGHQGGDEALRAVARAIGAQAERSGEVVGRFGGDEFVLVVPQAELAGSLALGERVRAAVAELHLRRGACVVPLSVSVGVAAVTPTLAVGREELLQRADRALYRAKHAGRGQAVALDVEAGVDVFYAPQAPQAAPAPARTTPTIGRGR